MPAPTQDQLQKLLTATAENIDKVKKVSCEVQLSTTVPKEYLAKQTPQMQRQLLSIQSDQYFWAWKAGYFVTKRVRFYAARDFGGMAETTELVTPENEIFYNGPSASSSLVGLTAQGSIRRHSGQETLPNFLDYGFRLGIEDLAELIRKSKFNFVGEKTDPVMGKIYVLKSGDEKQRLKTLEIAIDRGPLVTGLSGSRMADLRAQSNFKVFDIEKVDGFWVPTHGEGVLYLADGTPGRKDEMFFSRITVNRVTDKVFDLEFPPNTRVEDTILGKTYWTTNPPSYGIPLLAVSVLLVIAAIWLVIKRSRTFGPKSKSLTAQL